MGLYLCIFNEIDGEIDGVEFGNYSEYSALRRMVVQTLEEDRCGTKYPTFILHSDCDGEWSPAECLLLINELVIIRQEFLKRDPIPYPSEWQKEVSSFLGLKPTTLNDSFIDVDGEPVLDRLIELCKIAIESNKPILFQ